MNYRYWIFFLFTALFCSLSSLSGAGDCFELVGGFDGANPQLSDAIVREAADRYRIYPFNEEGSNDAYYFRFNTKVVNHCAEERGLELLIEWPALERHPGYPYDTYFYGKRGEWRWTYADVEGTTARFRIQVAPGETYVGFYPRYSYGHYEEFIHGLTPSSILEKWEEGRSFYGRKLHVVKITASGPEHDRLPILVTARNHPYETSGSYIAETMIEFLQGESKEAAEMRGRNIFYFLPMMNPDGVALGANQRTRPNGVNLSYGVGTDDPTLLTLLKLVQKIEPVLWADIHSWPHKGDDGMWATHQWVADGLLSQMPSGSFQDYVWNVSFVRERGTAENHLWQWLIQTFDSGGVSLSISWYRRNEPELVEIAVEILKALAYTAEKAPAEKTEYS
jgi:hypothetical protein